MDKTSSIIIYVLNLLFVISTMYVLIINFDKPLLFQGFIIGFMDGIIVIFFLDLINYIYKKRNKEKNKKIN